MAESTAGHDRPPPSLPAAGSRQRSTAYADANGALPLCESQTAERLSRVRKNQGGACA
jgi:hypothetical protein